MSNNYRVRIRFSKTGDLRLISHRDMVRAFERLFRRAGVALAMSQGFHPRPLMTFPDALSLGVEALDEAMDITFADEIHPDELKTLLQANCPQGLVIHSVRQLRPDERKAKIVSTVYEIDIPASVSLDKLNQAIDQLKRITTLTVERKEKQVELDLQATLGGVQLNDRRLVMNIRVIQQSQLQPRDILAALELDTIVHEGNPLTRTKIELIP